jgi:hypothetical protein
VRPYLVADQSRQAEFLGAAVVEAFDKIKARDVRELPASMNSGSWPS